MRNIFHSHGRAGVGVIRADSIIRAPLHSVAGARADFTRAPARAWAALRAWHNRRVAVRELSAMPDAQLRDIGIERYQIRDAVNGAYPDLIRPRAGAATSANTVSDIAAATVAVGDAVDSVVEIKQAA